jgi:hypothetical protein
MAEAARSAIYRRRRPERTVAYRALAHHFERFLQVYEERFESAFGYLRSVVERAVHRYLDCGLLDQGFARLRCEGCGESTIVAFSCKQRCVCPSCHQKRELLWVEWAAEELFEQVPHRQVVFTIPKRLRIYFRYDRRLLGELAGCAWRSLRLYLAASFDSEHPTPGGIGFIQTSGELLRFHPHIHILMADGAWLPDGTFRHLLYFDSEKVGRLFRAEVLRMLLEKGLIDAETVENILSWPHSGFSTNGSVRAESRDDAARLGRYMIRCPLVLDRLEWDAEKGEVVYYARPRRTGNPYGTVARWDVLEFIARLTQHIPNTSEQLLRYWGFYSNAARGKRRRVAPGYTDAAAGRSPQPETNSHHTEQRRHRRSMSWARLLRKVYEIDPLLCSYCGGELKIVAFITELSSVRRFLKGISVEPREPEPLAHSPPELEIVYHTI